MERNPWDAPCFDARDHFPEHDALVCVSLVIGRPASPRAADHESRAYAPAQSAGQLRCPPVGRREARHPVCRAMPGRLIVGVYSDMPLVGRRREMEPRPGQLVWAQLLRDAGAQVAWVQNRTLAWRMGARRLGRRAVVPGGLSSRPARACIHVVVSARMTAAGSLQPISHEPPAGWAGAAGAGEPAGWLQILLPQRTPPVSPSPRACRQPRTRRAG
jgi:hypothetical protein